MTDVKNQLAELIEAYAVAKSTGNQLLAQSAASNLIQFIEGIEISKSESEQANGGQE